RRGRSRPRATICTAAGSREGGETSSCTGPRPCLKLSVVQISETRYAQSGDVNIAYRVAGERAFDNVFLPPAGTNVGPLFDRFPGAGFLLRVASFSRLIALDKRGTGLSDRVPGIADVETRMDDVRAVMDAAGSERAAILGLSEGGPMSLVFGAT